MAKKSGSSFGDFYKGQGFDPRPIKPFTTEFSKGSAPGSIYAANRESAWSRWRRGYEIANATFFDNNYTYQFQYQIPVPSGTPSFLANPSPVISGAFVGYPTTNKEMGMHWAGWRYAGSMRSDKLSDRTTGTKLYVESITEDTDYWYVKLAGNWSAANPLPPPFYVAVPGVPGGLKPLNSEILEDRIVEADGPIIDRDTINPQTQKRYGYVQAVLVDTNPTTGILKVRKSGSVQITPDKEYITPSPVPFEVNRFLITGARFCCSCQDFTHRDYAFMRDLTKGVKRIYPRSSVTSIKPGRFEVMKLNNIPDNSAMTTAKNNRKMDVYSPSGYSLPPNTASNVVDNNATRDNPGVFRDFGATYIRSTATPARPGAGAEGMPTYQDYSSAQGEITSITDNWEPLLDEMRYCKHIYALKFADHTFPPEPSDFPVGEENMVAWEQKIVEDTENNQKGLRSTVVNRYALSQMDVPPYNCQSPMMMPMMQKLFNVPAEFIVMEGFTMFDKDGKPYKP